VVKMMADALQRFATGTYVIWYPVLPRLDAQELPRELLESRDPDPAALVALQFERRRTGDGERSCGRR